MSKEIKLSYCHMILGLFTTIFFWICCIIGYLYLNIIMVETIYDWRTGTFRASAIRNKMNWSVSSDLGVVGVGLTLFIDVPVCILPVGSIVFRGICGWLWTIIHLPSACNMHIAVGWDRIGCTYWGCTCWFTYYGWTILGITSGVATGCCWS
jgi:hypothetical protein